MAARNPDQNEAWELPPEVVTDLLSADRCRRALRLLDQLDRPVVVGDLAAAILAAERKTDPDAIPEADKKAVQEELYTEHLPKLTATGVVNYNSMVGTVELKHPEILPDSE